MTGLMTRHHYSSTNSGCAVSIWRFKPFSVLYPVICFGQSSTGQQKSSELMSGTSSNTLAGSSSNAKDIGSPTTTEG